jgi:hypothetical protein
MELFINSIAIFLDSLLCCIFGQKVAVKSVVFLQKRPKILAHETL